MYSRAYGAIYDAVYDYLLNNRGAIEARIKDRIKIWNPDTIEDDVKRIIYTILSENNIYDKLDIHPKNPALINAVDEYVTIMYMSFRDIIKDNEYKQERERQQQYERTKASARETLLTTSRLITRPVARRMKWLKDLTQADFDRIYTEYENVYLEQHPEQMQQIARQDTYMDKMKRFVIEHANDELPTLQQFINISSGWGTNGLSLERNYDTFKRLYFQQPGTTIAYTEQPFTGLIGFKGKNKVAAIKALQPTLKETTTQVNSFPLKQNKKYQLHKVAARYSYLIDLMFSGKLTYLVAININTRYLYVQLTNTVINPATGSYSRSSKTTFLFLKALQQLMKSGMKVKHLSGDGESAFNSIEAKQAFYEIYGIDFTPVKRQVMGAYPDYMKDEQKQVKTDPLHGSLGIIDRVIRTIRDMAYNMHVGNITPRIMTEIVRQYNNAPHKTLSKYAGFPVSPKMAQEDPALEEYIVRRICQENYNIMSSNGFNIPKGTKVKVYNETDKMLKRRSINQPGEFTVDGFNRGLYKVVSKNNTIQWLPRFRLAPVWA